MSRTMSRSALGLAAVSLGLGCTLAGAPAAWADSLEGSSATYRFTCADQDAPATNSQAMDIEVYVAAPAEAEVGQEIEFQVEPNDYNYYSYIDGGEITSGTLSADVALSGAAAPASTATASTQAQGSFGSNNEETFDESALRGTFTPTAPGDVTLAAGDITIDVQQSEGPSTTVCSPEGGTETLATVSVTGEPMPDQGGSPGPSESDQAAPGAQSDAPPEALLVFGAVVGGLLVIAGIVMLGLMFFFLRRS
ncbi:hypothetical protein [Streptomonospora litoralis]|uniref:Uncharacterized protein n=1 Tax=Streptomonospora litoralis TaxID=2498135 RepID=A0A4V0ZJ57_9ACTN|nr:hypothetical protein [Streptomonospora litoralis]QBI52322.1 hypothetical protein EKD16_02530 [Streptomonospora litoralis]